MHSWVCLFIYIFNRAGHDEWRRTNYFYPLSVDESLAHKGTVDIHGSIRNLDDQKNLLERQG